MNDIEIKLQQNQKDLDLLLKEKERLKKELEASKEVYYKIGDKFRLDGGTYMLCASGTRIYVLIDIDGGYDRGNRWKDAIEVKDCPTNRIPSSVIDRLAGGKAGKWTKI